MQNKQMAMRIWETLRIVHFCRDVSRNMHFLEEKTASWISLMAQYFHRR